MGSRLEMEERRRGGGEGGGEGIKGVEFDISESIQQAQALRQVYKGGQTHGSGIAKTK